MNGIPTKIAVSLARERVLAYLLFQCCRMAGCAIDGKETNFRDNFVYALSLTLISGCWYGLIQAFLLGLGFLNW